MNKRSQTLKQFYFNKKEILKGKCKNLCFLGVNTRRLDSAFRYNMRESASELAFKGYYVDFPGSFGN